MGPRHRHGTGAPEPWGERDREIAGRPVEGDWLGADEPERFGEEIREHLTRARLASVFLESPAFMAVLRGPEHEVVNANPALYRLVGRRRLLGRPARAAFPELAGSGYLETLDRVFATGERHVGSRETIRLVRSPGRESEPVHVSFVYHPLLEDDGSSWGILVHGVDLTRRWEARQTLRRRARQQAAVAELGREALEGTDPAELARSACARMAEELAVPRTAFLERDPEGHQLVLAQGRGWPEGAVGSTVRANPDTPEGRALRDRQPVALAAEEGIPAVHESEGDGPGAVLAVAIRSRDEEPVGVLAAYAEEPRVWDQEETDFVQALAHLVGTFVAWRETERRLSTVVENLPGILYRCRNDRSWTMEYLSPGSRELTGWRPDQLIGTGGPAYGDLIHPDDRDEVWASVQEAVEADRPFRLLYRIRTRDGGERWVWEQGRAVETATPAAGRLEGCILDVTEWKRAQQEAERTRRLVEATFRGLEDAVFVVHHPERAIEACNPAAERMFGWEEDELVGASTERLHPDREHYERFGRESRQALDREGVYRGEHRMRRADGTTFDTEHVVSYVGDGESPERAVSVVRDVTDRKERERQLREERERFRQVAENVREVFWLTPPDKAEILYVSPAYEEIWGRSREDLRRDPGSWVEAIHPEDRDRVVDALPTQRTGGYEEEYRIVRPDGDVRWVRDRAYPIRDEDGEVVRVVGVAEDITQQKVAERERERARKRYTTLFEVSPTAISVTTLEEGRVLEINEAFEELYGWDRNDALGRSVHDLSLWPREDARERVVRHLREEDAIQGMELTLRTRDGESVEVLFSAELLEIGDRACVLGASQDITERKRAERQLQRLALHDTLTGLPNRNLFVDRLEHALDRTERTGARVAVFFLDLDRFKVVNDTLGHTAGDELLTRVAARLRDRLREEDTVARLGGDEFGCLLEEVTSAEEVDRAAARVSETFEAPFEVADTEVHVDASIGIALGGDGDPAEDLLRFSDVAMYRVKEDEGTRYHVFDPAADRDETLRLHRENELRRAIEEEALGLEFQPVFRLADRRVVGAEALVRWEHPERGTVPPAEFIPLAEQSGLIVPLGYWVLEEAAELGARWHEIAPAPFSLTVNLSARQYQEEDVARRISETAEACGLPLDALQLEITESVLMSGHGKFRELRRRGVRVAIDDFGTGYSSLQYLRELDADVLKIDRTFVADLDVDRRDTVLVEAILLVAREMGLDVVAEGIESEAQLERLRAMDCPYGQGYHLARPMGRDRFQELLEKGRLG